MLCFFPRIDPSPVALLLVAALFFACMIRHGSVSEQSRFLHVFTVLCKVRRGEPEGCRGGGLTILVKAGNLCDSWDYRDDGRENQSCVLPERRQAMWSRLLIMESEKNKTTTRLQRL